MILQKSIQQQSLSCTCHHFQISNIYQFATYTTAMAYVILLLINLFVSAKPQFHSTHVRKLSVLDYNMEKLSGYQLINISMTTKPKQQPFHKRIHRDTLQTTPDIPEIYLSFESTWRNFNIILQQKNRLITKHTHVKVVDGSNENLQQSADLINDFYVGKGICDGQSPDGGTDIGQVHGHVDLRRGMFDGVVHTSHETFYIEPASRYFSDLGNISVIYRDSDIKMDMQDQHLTCNIPSNENKQWISQCGNKAQNKDCSRRLSSVDRRRRRAVSSWWTALHSPNITKTCTIHAVADHRFFQKSGGGQVSATLTEIIYHLTEADTVFRSTDFDGNGVGDNIGFSLTNVTIFAHRDVARYKMASDVNEDVYTYLDNFSLYDFSHACLAIAFTDIDFDGGVVGLAWLGKSSYYSAPGGICQRPVRLISSSTFYSFNTAMVTFTNFGKHVPRKLATLTLIHELGHSFGSPHDPKNNSVCAPGGKFGNYIMFPQASDADKPYNNRFSTCSRDHVAPVLQNKGQCMKLTTGPVCGNGIVEVGEECDCGSPDQCELTNHCCTPPGGHLSDPGCTFQRSEGKQCDPSVSPCCRHDCTVITSPVVCHEGSECMLASVCDGVQPTCPASTIRPDGTMCMSYTRTCVGGYCVGSVCDQHGLQECQCTVHTAHMCHVCCRQGHSALCQPAYLHGIRAPDGFQLRKLAGQACNNYTGFCNERLVCVLVTSDSTTRRLQELFSATTMQLVQKWFENYWYLLLLSIAALTGLASVFYVYEKKTVPHHTLALKCAHITRAWSYACSVERNIRSRMDRIEVDFQKRLAKFHRVKPLDLVLAMSRMLVFFPSATPQVVLSVLSSASSEEFAVKQMLIKGHRMRRICYTEEDNNISDEQNHTKSPE